MLLNIMVAFEAEVINAIYSIFLVIVNIVTNAIVNTSIIYIFIEQFMHMDNKIYIYTYTLINRMFYTV